MHTWAVANSILRFVCAGAYISVALVVWYALRPYRRTTTARAMLWIGFLALDAGLIEIVTASFSTTETAWLLPALLMLPVVAAIVVSINLIRILPRSVAFQDGGYLHNAVQELRESKSRFQRAIDGSLNGLWEWDLDTNTVWYSQRFRELLGYSAADRFPNQLETFKVALHPDDANHVWSMVDQHLQNDEGYDVEYRLRTKTGEYRWFGARGMAIRNPEGRAYLMSGSIQDIHARKQAEEQAHNRNEYLMRKQKMEALGELAGETAHEINNLLQAISGQIQFAEEAIPENSSARNDLTVASDIIEQSAQFTRQLLDFSRLRTKKLEPVDPNAIVERLAIVVRPILGKDIDFQVRLSPSVQPVLADSNELQQVLLNLCINARDAMPHGGKLTIETGALELSAADPMVHSGIATGGYSTIAVVDTGCGMSEEVKSHIFEPFFTTKAAGRGTGLGLAVAYGVVTEGNGIIDVESTPGQGSRFTVLLPIADRTNESNFERRNVIATNRLEQSALLLTE
jgi:PAS domain S-box-containing protein